MRKEDIEILNQKDRPEWLDLIYRWVHDEVTRKILERFLLDKATQEQIAAETGYSVNAVQKRISDGKKQLFDHI